MNAMLRGGSHLPLTGILLQMDTLWARKVKVKDINADFYKEE